MIMNDSKEEKSYPENNDTKKSRSLIMRNQDALIEFNLNTFPEKRHDIEFLDADDIENLNPGALDRARDAFRLALLEQREALAEEVLAAAEVAKELRNREIDELNRLQNELAAEKAAVVELRGKLIKLHKKPQAKKAPRHLRGR